PGVAGQVSPSQSNPQTSRNCLTPRWAWSAPRRAQHLAIATSGMSLTMGRPIVEASAIALTPPHCGLSLPRTWRPRATGLTLIRWRIHDERPTWHLRRRLLQLSRSRIAALISPRHQLGIPSAAAVGTGEDLQEVAVRILEI